MEKEKLENFILDLYGFIDSEQFIYVGIEKENNFPNIPIKLSCIEPKYKTKSLVEKLIDIIENNKERNIYITPMTFYRDYSKKGCQKNNDNVRYCNVLYCDIDKIKEIDMLKTNEDIENFLINRNKIFSKIFPHYVVKSGHGLHLYFILSEEFHFYVDSKTNDKFKTILTKLCFLAGGDKNCIDISRYLRLPYSNNCKSGIIKTELFEFENMNLYSLQEYEDIFNHYINDEEFESYCNAPQGSNLNKKKKNDKKTIDSKKEKIKPIYELTQERKIAINNYVQKCKRKSKIDNTYNDRISFLDKVLEHRNFDIIGHRDNFIMVIARLSKNANMEKENTLILCNEYNSKFIEPLEDIEIKNIVNYIYENIEKQFLRISNLGIQQLLEITPEEQDLDHTQSYFKEHKQYKKTLICYQSRQKEITTLKEMDLKYAYYFFVLETNPFASEKELSEILGVSTRQIRRIRNKYQEHLEK